MRRWPDPNLVAVARLLRGPVEVVPDPVEPDPHLPGLLREPPRQDPSVVPTTSATRTPAVSTVAMCGHCQHGHAGHGVQYGALVGWHTWAPEKWSGSKSWSEIVPAPERNPR